MDNLRLFVGIGVAEEVIGPLAAVIDRMEADLPFRRWTHPADLHITMHFLGDTRTEQMEAVRAALAEAARAAVPMRLALTEPGTFGPPHSPRVLWLGVKEQDGPGGLSRLHAALAPGLAAAGFALDERPFRPHVTLARQGGAGCGNEQIQAAWRNAAAAVSSPLEWTADRITLFCSRLGRRPSYEQLEHWRF